MSDFRSFGQPWQPGLPEHNGWTCPECLWEFFGAYPNLHSPLYDNVVGFDTGVPHSERRGVGGGFIVVCPCCSTRFWLHATNAHISNLLRLREEGKLVPGRTGRET